MSNGSPPSSRPYLAEDPALVEARGTLRDALGALGNLDQLLRSLRVGPRALSTVLPDVLDSCEPAVLALDRLLDAARRQLGDALAVSALERYFKPRFDELKDSISRATKTPMHARHRLELERVVTRLSSELEAARGLLDLLEEALGAPSIRLKLRELLSQITVPDQRESESIRCSLHGEVDDVELLVKPQVTMSLLTLGINLVAQVEPAAIARVEVHSLPDGSCTIRFGRGTKSSTHAATASEELHVGHQTVIDPTFVCLEEAVKRMGCHVTRDPDGVGFSVSWS
jgi:hypothetical protein